MTKMIMMKQTWFMVLLILIGLSLTGCGGEEVVESIPPLDNSQWPTPAARQAVPTATAFPKISADDWASEARDNVTNETTLTVEQATVETSAANQLTDTLIKPVAAGPDNLVQTLTPIAPATVAVSAVNIRQGPGTNYGRIGTLNQGTAVNILALNDSTKDWGLVELADGTLGWVALTGVDNVALLDIDGSLANAHTLPDSPLPAGQIAPVSEPNAPGKTVVQTAVRTSVSEVAAADHIDTTASQAVNIRPLGTVRPNRREIKLYKGPGLNFETGETFLDDESGAVLAVDETGEWLLVQIQSPGLKTPGWGRMSDLLVEGDISPAPSIISAWVESNEIPVYSGPAIFYPQSGTLAMNDIVIVIGLSDNDGWALVQPLFGTGQQGWVLRRYLELNGSWHSVPDAPTPTLAETAPSTPAIRTDGVPHGSLVVQRSSGGDILVIDADGTDLRKLTTGIDPALSPDGQTVAFTRWTNGEQGTLWLINTDGTNERPIAGDAKQAKYPAWSPDGSEIVMAFQNEGRVQEKRVCRTVIELGGEAPDIPFNVNPDDIYQSAINGIPAICWILPPDPHWGLRLVDLADNSYQDLPSTTYAFSPVWDPAQPWRVVSSGDQGLVQLDIDRQEQSALTQHQFDRTPAFSPDGRYLAVAVNQGGYYDIHRLNADGTGRQRLTQTPLWVTAGPDERHPWHNVSPVWSPDGSLIAFLTDRTGRWEIWIMNADGSNQRPLFSDETTDQLALSYNFVDEHVLNWGQ